MGQEKSDVAGLVPLALCRGDEVVEDHLGSIEEVSELGFPQDQEVRVAQGISIFEA